MLLLSEGDVSKMPCCFFTSLNNKFWLHGRPKAERSSREKQASPFANGDEKGLQLIRRAHLCDFRLLHY